MTTRTAKNQGKIVSLLLDKVAKLAARKRAYGVWRGRTEAMIKENRRIRKEWDKRVRKLGW